MNIHSLLFYRTIVKFSTLFLESSKSQVLVKNAFQARLVIHGELVRLTYNLKGETNT